MMSPFIALSTTILAATLISFSHAVSLTMLNVPIRGSGGGLVPDQSCSRHHNNITMMFRYLDELIFAGILEARNITHSSFTRFFRDAPFATDIDLTQLGLMHTDTREPLPPTINSEPNDRALVSLAFYNFGQALHGRGAATIDLSCQQTPYCIKRPQLTMYFSDRRGRVYDMTSHQVSAEAIARPHITICDNAWNNPSMQVVPDLCLPPIMTEDKAAKGIHNDLTTQLLHELAHVRTLVNGTRVWDVRQTVKDCEALARGQLDGVLTVAAGGVNFAIAPTSNAQSYALMAREAMRARSKCDIRLEEERQRASEAQVRGSLGWLEKFELRRLLSVVGSTDDSVHEGQRPRDKAEVGAKGSWWSVGLGP